MTYVSPSLTLLLVVLGFNTSLFGSVVFAFASLNSMSTLPLVALFLAALFVLERVYCAMADAAHHWVLRRQDEATTLPPKSQLRRFAFVLGVGAGLIVTLIVGPNAIAGWV